MKIWYISDATLYRESVTLNTLDKASKHGIAVVDLVEKYEEIDYAIFEEPCFLLVQIGNLWFFHTPFAIFRIEGEYYPGNPSQVFRKITGVKRVPYGKDAMKKIEALLIQGSI